MASLEYINFNPWREIVEGRDLAWERDGVARGIEGLPQIFWQDGSGWAEANHWSLAKITDHRVEVATVKSLMKHLHAYACFLEAHDLEWRHFPTRLAERAVVRFRGDLIQQINCGRLASSTARSRINAVVQFYRHAAVHDFVSPTIPMWRDQAVVIRYFDSVGFKRSLTPPLSK